MPPDKPDLILLASASPRRRELIAMLGLPFQVTSADIDETWDEDSEDAEEYTCRLSYEKAHAVLDQAPHNALIVAADTTVADEGEVLGKPADADEARAMLRRLRDHPHKVYTALAVVRAADGRTVQGVAETSVMMRRYTDAEIEDYIATGDPFDKAGGYAIQHPGFRPVAFIGGCYTNVVGLPLCLLTALLRDMGIEPLHDVAAGCDPFAPDGCKLRDVLSGGPSAWAAGSRPRPGGGL